MREMSISENYEGEITPNRSNISRFSRGTVASVAPAGFQGFCDRWGPGCLAQSGKSSRTRAGHGFSTSSDLQPITNPAITAYLISRLVAGLSRLTRADGYYRL